MSDYADIIDSVLLEIQEQVAGFAPSVIPTDDRHVHKYAPWNPLELVADGQRHVAMWPVAEIAEEATPLAQGFANLQHTFVVLAWESDAAQSTRQMPNESRDRAWLDVANALRDFFYRDANRQRAYPWGGYYRIRHAGTQFPDEPGSVRWVGITIVADRSTIFA